MANLNFTKEGIKNKTTETMKILKEEISDEQVERNLEKCPIKNPFIRKYIVVIPAALSIIALLFPFMSFSASNSYASTNVTVSGLDIFFGDYSTLFGWILLLCPILIILSNFIEKIKPFRRAIAICFPVISLIFEIITYFACKSTYLNATGVVGGTVDCDTSFGLGFFILLISYILTVLVGYIAYLGISPKKKQ